MARLRVVQESPSATRLQARVWLAGQLEPATWMVDVTDSTPSLQGVSGAIAVDSYSSITSGAIAAGTFIDDIRVN